MEAVDRGIVVPTAEEVDALQGITNPGEQLVAYYSVGERIGATYNNMYAEYVAAMKGPEDETCAQDAWDIWHQAESTKALGTTLLVALNSKFLTEWDEAKIHVATLIDSGRPVIDTYRQDIHEPIIYSASHRPKKFLGNRHDVTGREYFNTHGRVDDMMKPLSLEQRRWGEVRAPLLHYVDVVEPGTGVPLVKVEFLK